jgi:hypothetical protein
MSLRSDKRWGLVSKRTTVDFTNLNSNLNFGSHLGHVAVMVPPPLEPTGADPPHIRTLMFFECDGSKTATLEKGVEPFRSFLCAFCRIIIITAATSRGAEELCWRLKFQTP